jgi:hypothetical protein
VWRLGAFLRQDLKDRQEPIDDQERPREDGEDDEDRSAEAEYAFLLHSMAGPSTDHSM